MENRIITTDVTEEDYTLEGSLRPRTLDEYIGQEKTKNTLRIYIEAAKQRHDALDHVLFYGPPGLGKTTLSGIIANEMGTHLKVTSGPAIEKPGEMAAILNNLQEGDVLFVDEIHRLNRQVEEVLYPAMEDFAIDIMIGKGASARSIRLDLPRFTLVGATTRAGLLSAPLRDRFGVVHHLEFYSQQELATIVIRSAQVLGVEIDPKGAAEIAKRSRGTPRLANRLLKRVRDFAQVKYDGRITLDVANFALDLLEVDSYGLDKLDRKILQTMIQNFQGGPVGLETLAAAIGEDAGTLEDVYEPYLLQNGFLADGLFDTMRKKATPILSEYYNIGDGWLVMAEAMDMIEQGYDKILIVHPFGCLVSHVAERGVLKKLRQLYPGANINTIEYDYEQSQALRESRIMLATS